MNEPIERLVEQFRRLPGIGVKSARRLAYHMVEQSDEYVREFVNAITEAKSRTCYCSVCCHLSTQDPCEICKDTTRDRSVVLVVEDPKDVNSLEKLRIEVARKEKERGTHNQYACSISQLKHYIENGFTYKEFEHDAMYAKKKNKENKKKKD